MYEGQSQQALIIMRTQPIGRDARKLLLPLLASKFILKEFQSNV